MTDVARHDLPEEPDAPTRRWRLVPAAVRRMVRAMIAFGEAPGDPVELRLRKSLLVSVALMVLPASVIWGVLYWLAGERGAALLPWSYTLASLGSLAAFRMTRNFPLLRETQLLIILVAPFVLAIVLGGLAASGMVIIWSFLAPLGAITFDTARRSWRWFAGFALALVTVTPLSSILRPEPAALPEGLLVAFLVMNAGAVALIAFVLLVTFAMQRQDAQRRAEDLLLNILPAEIAELLKTDSRRIAEQFDETSVLFADVVEFTPLSARLSASEVVSLLDELFTGFDALADRYGVEKIKTIGDAYMVAAGVPARRADHAHALAAMALDMRDLVATGSHAQGRPMELRIGINSGPVVAGVIGRRKFIYDLWGDVVNTASRMESHGAAGQIQITESTYELIKDAFVCEPRGVVEVKGKGAVHTWYLIARRPPEEALASGSLASDPGSPVGRPAVAPLRSPEMTADR